MMTSTFCLCTMSVPFFKAALSNKYINTSKVLFNRILTNATGSDHLLNETQQNETISWHIFMIKTMFAWERFSLTADNVHTVIYSSHRITMHITRLRFLTQHFFRSSALQSPALSSIYAHIFLMHHFKLYTSCLKLSYAFSSYILSQAHNFQVSTFFFTTWHVAKANIINKLKKLISNLYFYEGQRNEPPKFPLQQKLQSQSCADGSHKALEASLDIQWRINTRHKRVLQHYFRFIETKTSIDITALLKSM